MIGPIDRQNTLFYVAFGKQASLIKDDLLDAISPHLDDPALVQLVLERLGSRSPRSESTGRPTIAPDRLLRCHVLKHLKDWSFRELERELRNNLSYRRFTGFNEDPIPNFTVFSRVFALLGPDVTERIHQRVVQQAKEQRVAPGRKLRLDTTVVETNIHHPTDSSLLADGIRVLTRTAKAIADECKPGVVAIVDHARSVKHRVLEINRAAKSFATAGKERLKEGYSKLLDIAGGVARKAQGLLDDLKNRRIPIVGNNLKVIAQEVVLEHFLPLVKKVVNQARERVFEGNSRVVGKVLSLFEPYTAAIKKGKSHKPTEFGALVRLDEVENGIVSHYEVQEGNPADTNALVPAIDQHMAAYGRPPRATTADRGFFSASNEEEAKRLGVEKVALPARGRLSESRLDFQKQRWFKRLLRWRAGIEARIATLKHRYGMLRSVYKGHSGLLRHVGWSVIVNNIVSIARALARRKAKNNVQESK